MFIYDDLMSRKGFGAVQDFCEIAHDLDLLDIDQSPEREIFITTDALKVLDEWDAMLKNAVLAEFLLFLTNEVLLWGDLRHGNHLKPLDPALRWVEFKIRTSPQVRIFGAFVQQNFFIAISSDYRNAVPTSDELLAKWVSLWGDDAYRMPIDDVDALLTNYRIAADE